MSSGSSFDFLPTSSRRTDCSCSQELSRRDYYFPERHSGPRSRSAIDADEIKQPLVGGVCVGVWSGGGQRASDAIHPGHRDAADHPRVRLEPRGGVVLDRHWPVDERSGHASRGTPRGPLRNPCHSAAGARDLFPFHGIGCAGPPFEARVHGPVCVDGARGRRPDAAGLRQGHLGAIRRATGLGPGDRDGRSGSRRRTRAAIRSGPDHPLRLEDRLRGSRRADLCLGVSGDCVCRRAPPQRARQLSRRLHGDSRPAKPGGHRDSGFSPPAFSSWQPQPTAWSRISFRF